MNNFNKLIEIRNICKKYAFSDNAKKSHFYKKSNLDCMCAVASAFLFKNMPKSKFVVGYFNGNGHCWVEQDGCIFDITASQFGEKDIIVTFDKDPRYFVKKKYKNIPDFTCLVGQSPQIHDLFEIYGVI